MRIKPYSAATKDSLDILMILAALELDIDSENVMRIWTYRNEKGLVQDRILPNTLRVEHYSGPYLGIDFKPGYLPMNLRENKYFLNYVHFTNESDYFRVHYAYPECLQ